MNKNEIENIVRAMRSYAPSIEVQDVTPAEIDDMLMFIRYDYPTTFHVGQIRYSIHNAAKKVILRPEYTINETEYNDLMARCLDKLKEWQGKIERYKTDYDKELFIHDELCRSVKYADEDDYSHSMIGPLLYGKGVCDGIAKAAHQLFHLSGIRSHVIGGEARNSKTGVTEAHAWNLVMIGGEWYNLDITFDNTISSDGIRHDYFNLSENAIRADHCPRPQYSGYLSKCTAENDYFARNGVAFKNENDAVKYIEKAIKMKDRAICFRLDPPVSEATRKLIADVFTAELQKTCASYSFTSSANDARNVFYWKVSYGESISGLFESVLGLVRRWKGR